jgi:hypothetical protein
MSVFPASSRDISKGTVVPGAAVLAGAAIGGLATARPLPLAACAALAGLLPLSALAIGAARRAALLGVALAYAGVLAWTHTTQFAPLFGYQGLVDGHPEGRAVVVMIVLAALPAAWLPISAGRPSAVLLWSLYIAGYVPAVVIPIFLTADLAAVLPLALTLLAALMIVSVLTRLPLVRVTSRHLSPRAFLRMMTGLSIATSVYVLVTFGFSTIPSLGNVYAARSAFNTGLEGANWPAGYVVPWAGNVVNPLLMALALSRRRMDLFAVAMVGQLVIYSDTGFKNVLFSTALIPLVYLALSLARRSYGTVAVMAIPAVLLVGTIVNALTSDWALTLLRRQFATPGQLNWYYFDFFSDHSRYHLSASFLSGVFTMPYSSEPAVLIGQVYFPAEHPHANAGLWADAFANFGTGGVVVFSMVLGLVLWALDGSARDRDIRLIGPMVAIAGLSLAEGALFTTLLTLGLGLACLLVVAVPPGRASEWPGWPRSPAPPSPARTRAGR